MSEVVGSSEIMESEAEALYREFSLKALSDLPRVMEENCFRNVEDGERRAHIIKEDLPNCAEKEKLFCRMIIEAFARWAKEEKSPVVLWDVDETMGKYRFVKDGTEWGFRPVIIPLFEFLKEKFPNITHGILSGRSEIQSQLDDSNRLLRISRFIDSGYIYSAEGKYVPSRVREEYEKNALDAGFFSVVVAKGEILRELRESGKNVKDIDDAVAALQGADGVCVYEMSPNDYFCG